MAKDITTLSLTELEKDREDSLRDITACTSALMIGITFYSGGSVKSRLRKNEMFVSVIDAELKRRKEGGDV